MPESGTNQSFGNDVFARLFGGGKQASATQNRQLQPPPPPPATAASLRGAPFTGPTQSIHPPQARMRLYELTGSMEAPGFGSFLEFDYTPDEFSDTKASDWEEDGKKVCVTRPKFKGSHGRKIGFTLFLNDWGEEPGHKTSNMGCEQAIEWLRTKQCVSKQSIAGGESPPVLAFVWREVFKCVLVKADVTRVKLDPQTLDAIRANVDIELMEWAPKPI